MASRNAKLNRQRDRKRRNEARKIPSPHTLEGAVFNFAQLAVGDPTAPLVGCGTHRWRGNPYLWLVTTDELDEDCDDAAALAFCNLESVSRALLASPVVVWEHSVGFDCQTPDPRGPGFVVIDLRSGAESESFKSLGEAIARADAVLASNAGT